MLSRNRSGIVSKKSRTVFFAIFQNSQNDHFSVLLSRRNDCGEIFMSLFHGYFVNTHCAQMGDAIPIHLNWYPSFERSQHRVIPNSFFQTHVFDCAADQLFHQVVVIPCRMRTSLLIPGQYLSYGWLVQTTFTLTPFGADANICLISQNGQMPQC